MRRDGGEYRSVIHSDIEDTGRSGFDPNGVSLGRVLGLQGNQAIMNVPAESARSKGSPR
jgi:hypothetical protein